MTYYMSMKTTVTFIPGMFSPFINTFLGTYFIDQMEYLNSQGTPYEIMPVHTEGSLDKNASIIRNNILTKDKVVAFCHSKGGIDLLHALILFPEIRKKFKKIIFMQCPFWGTPLADFALNGKAPMLATKGLFKVLLKGDIVSVVELTKSSRAVYMNKHESAIQSILESIEIDCIGSAKLPERGRFDSILKIPRDFIQFKYEVPNDGMIPTSSAFIPGARRTTFDDLDHASAVIRLTPQYFDRKAFSHKVFEGALT